MKQAQNKDSKNKLSSRPVLKLNLGVKALPETVLKKIEKLKSQQEAPSAGKGASLNKQKQEKKPDVSKASDMKENLKVKKAEEGKEKDITVNTASALEQKQVPAQKKWLLDPRIFTEMLKKFRMDFPECFTMERRPLALNIRQALIDTRPEYTHMQIAKFLKIYCRRVEYKKKLVLGAERVSLNGQVQSLVTEEQLAKDRSNTYKAEK